MISTVLFFTLCVLFFYKPVTGCLVFVALNTGGAGIAEMFFNRANFWVFSASEAALVVPVVSLYLRGPSLRGADPLRAIAWAMTVCGILSIVFFDKSPAREVVHNIILKAVFWGPLFDAFTRLTDKERKWLQYGLMAAGALTGLIVFVGVLTGWPMIIERLSLARGADLSIRPDLTTVSIEQRLTRRFAVPGFYSLMTIGFWLCVWGGVRWWQAGRVRRAVLCIAGCGAIVLGIAVNFARSIAMGLVVGLAVVLSLAWISPKRTLRIVRKQLLLWIVMAVIGLIIGLELSPAVRSFWTERLSGADSSVSLDARLEQDSWMVNKLLGSLNLLGTGEPLQFVGGDPHFLATAWWTYGSLFVLCLLLLLGLSLARLLRAVLGSGPDSPTNVLAALMWIGCFVNWQFLHASGGYLFDNEWFGLIFLLSEVSVITFVTRRMKRPPLAPLTRSDVSTRFGAY